MVKSLRAGREIYIAKLLRVRTETQTIVEGRTEATDNL